MRGFTWITTVLITAGGLFLCGPASAAEKVELKVGDVSPSFELPDDSGAIWKSAEHFGKKLVVVYFYPADCTGGCTKQAKGYSRDLDELSKKGIEVVGISGDSVENHQIFKKMEGLRFPLLADETGKVALKFGVPVSKGGEVKRPFEGREVLLKRGVTAQRWTFVVGLDGRILYKNSKVNAAEDSQAILKLIAESKLPSPQ